MVERRLVVRVEFARGGGALAGYYVGEGKEEDEGNLVKFILFIFNNRVNSPST